MGKEMREEMRNKSLFRHCREFTKNLFETYIQGKFPREIDDNLYELSFILVHNKTSGNRLAETDVSDLEEYRKVLSALEKNEHLKKSLSRDRFRREACNGLVHESIKRILEKNNHFDESIFADVYREWENEIYSEYFPFLVLVPIYNVTLESSKELPLFTIEIDDKKATVKIIKKEFGELVDFIGGYERYCLSEFDFHFDEIYLEISGLLKRLSNMHISSLNIDFDIKALLTKLRLFMNGDIRFGTIARKVQSRFFGWMNITGYKSSPNSRIKYNFDCFNLQKFKKFSSLWEEGAGEKFRENFSLSSEYFESAKEKEKLRDKLIDYMIVLESLLTEGTSELGFQISFRTALLISKDEKEFISNKDRLKELYNKRSRIVHGEKTKHPEKSKNQVTVEDIEFLGEAVRKVLIIFFLLHTSKYRGLLPKEGAMREYVISLMNTSIFTPSLRKKLVSLPDLFEQKS
jgi:hypothetical protein